jgi:transcriptional pleiotropic regulator of transition state genes
MKEVGIVRKPDPLGRITLPVEIRRQLDLKEGASVEIFYNEDKIILRKYEYSCVFCDSTTGITRFKGKAICSKCRIAMENYDV